MAHPGFQKFLCRLAVTLIHGKEEKGHHQPDHQKHRRGITNGAAGKEIHRNPHKGCQTETNELAFRQIESQLGLDFG